MSVLETLLNVVETACELAKAIRSDPRLLAKLTEEKVQGKNERFAADFKTLADVLIQEMARHRIEAAFPSTTARVFGEEEPTITNALGVSVPVKMSESHEEVRSMLVGAMAGDEAAADALLPILLRPPSGNHGWQLDPEPRFDMDDLGFWIDPIDGTNVFIQPEPERDSSLAGVRERGLECVTVLLGAFSLRTGQPLLGVVGHPFATREGDEWTSALYWGGTDGHRPFISPNIVLGPDSDHLRVVLSSSDDIGPRLEAGGAWVGSGTGAGYKLLCVVRGSADVYACSRDSVFAYDTAAPHAILRALGGGIASFHGDEEIVYAGKEAGSYQHTRGVLAYASPKAKQRCRQILSQH